MCAFTGFIWTYHSEYEPARNRHYKWLQLPDNLYCDDPVGSREGIVLSLLLVLLLGAGFLRHLPALFFRGVSCLESTIAKVCTSIGNGCQRDFCRDP